MQPTKTSRAGALIVAMLMIALAGVAGCATASTDDPPQVRTPAQFDQSLHDLLPERIKQSKEIVFGALWETPPIIGLEPENTSKPVGISPDLATALGEVLGVRPVWRNMQWPAQLPGLQSGNVDVLFGQVSDGVEREQVVDLVRFYRSPMGLLLAGGNEHGVQTMADTCGLKIGVPTGSQQEAVIAGTSETFCTSQGKPAIEAVGYPGAQNAIVALKGGTVDAWMDAVASTRVIAEESSGTFESLALPDEQVDAYMERGVALAASKSQPGLSNALAGALVTLARSGAYQEIMQRWGAGDSVLTPEEITVNVYTGLPAGQAPAAGAGS